VASKGKTPSTERALVRRVGVVQLRELRGGTASAHRGVVLCTDGGEALPLVRVGANPFDDPETRALEGHRVCLEGYVVGQDFRFVRVVADEG
jgi:hypothetical protein